MVIATENVTVDVFCFTDFRGPSLLVTKYVVIWPEAHNFSKD